MVHDRHRAAPTGRHLLDQCQTQSAPGAGPGQLGGVALGEDSLGLAETNPGAGVVHLDHNVTTLLPDGDLDPTGTAVRRSRRRVERVVDQIANDGNQITGVPGIAVEPAIWREAELDAPLSRDR